MKKIFLTAGEQPPVLYMKALRALGAEPVTEGDPSVCDGLMLCGGGDPDPLLFGQKNQGSYGISRERDQLELSCIHLFLKAEKPILGICRGNQMLNIAFGGTLVQHLPSVAFHLTPERDVFHEIRTDGLLRRLYGHRMTVNSRHHQGLGKIGRGLRIIGIAEDGVVEAIAHERLPVVGVQFHPERMENGRPLLEWFLNKCQAHPAQAGKR